MLANSISSHPLSSADPVSHRLCEEYRQRSSRDMLCGLLELCFSWTSRIMFSWTSRITFVMDFSNHVCRGLLESRLSWNSRIVVFVDFFRRTSGVRTKSVVIRGRTGLWLVARRRLQFRTLVTTKFCCSSFWIIDKILRRKCLGPFLSHSFHVVS